ncbi:chorismate mutase [Anabaena sp. UHCC 0399]|nr:chorismate mutase [Anabaena sp. UHCC 0399]MEA5566213.1 chorismate mutase [Anabaena sp. UHCC 0399]
MQAIRGATTVSDNTVEAMRGAVTELLDELERRNQVQPQDMISVTFSVTRDLDAIFPAAIARPRPGWDNVAMLDVQQMHVEGSLQRCIRFLIHAYIPTSTPIHHIYLREAKKLRPDWSLPQALQAPQQVVESKV